jgi:hypothetical protein
MGQLLGARELAPARRLSVVDLLSQTSKPRTAENAFAGLSVPPFSNPNSRRVAKKSAKKKNLFVNLRSNWRVQAGCVKEIIVTPKTLSYRVAFHCRAMDVSLFQGQLLFPLEG